MWCYYFFMQYVGFHNCEALCFLWGVNWNFHTGRVAQMNYRFSVATAFLFCTAT
jgi:hypothetical protein